MEAKSPNNDSVSIPIVVPSTGQTEDPSEEQATITTRHFRKQAPREKNRALSQISPRIWVTWCNVYYKIPLEPRTFRERLGIRKKGVPPEWKEILFGLSGDVKPGEIIGMLGSSGAGKTTLLNVLAGRLQAGQVQGDIRVNGAKRGRNWKRIAAYVEQDDVMYWNLTVRETIEFAAMLKLPRSMSHVEKRERVDEVLKILGLEGCQNTRIGDSTHRGISGGERKRTAIGIEMVTQPRLIFLDEPTTGLDAFTAQTIVQTMQDLAHIDKRTLLVTIHQPRANILHLFDRILLLSQGRTVFFGTIDECLEFFAGAGYPCPHLENPADFFIDTITLDFRTPEGRQASIERSERLQAAWQQIQSTRLASEICDPPKMMEDQTTNRTDEKVEWPCLWTTEFYHLYVRSWRILARDVQIMVAQVLSNLVIALLLGFIFFQLPDTFPGVQGRIGVLFFIPVNLTFTIVTPLIAMFALDRAIILRERYSATYRISAAYLARFGSLFPSRMLLTIFFSLIIYWIIGLQPAFIRFLIFCGFLLLATLDAICLGMFIASLAPTVELGQLYGSLFIVFFLLFGGNFANASAVTWILRWFQYISPIFYAFQGLIQNELAGQTFNGIPGDFYLNQYSLNQIPPVACAGAMLGLAFVFLLLGYLCLRRNTRPKFILA